MGTFHPDAHTLHGITCVVETSGPVTYIGRVDTIDARGVVLLDVDRHDASPVGTTKAEFLAKAAAVGHWPRHPRVIVPVADVVSVTRLGEIANR